MLSNGTTNIDSITNFRDYIARAKELGMSAICFTEHGNIFEWIHKKEGWHEVYSWYRSVYNRIFRRQEKRQLPLRFDCKKL